MTIDPLLRDFLLAAVNFAAGYTYARFHVRSIVHKAANLTARATEQMVELDAMMKRTKDRPMVDRHEPMLARCTYCGHSSAYPHDPDCPLAKHES